MLMSGFVERILNNPQRQCRSAEEMWSERQRGESCSSQSGWQTVPSAWSRYITRLMFAVRVTPQDSAGFTPFELLFGHRVRTPMTLLKHLWTGEKEDPEVKTSYQYVLDLRERIEETCQLAQEEIAKVQKRNQTYYNRRARERRLN